MALRTASPVDGKLSGLNSASETGPIEGAPGSSDGVGDVYGGGDERGWLNCTFVSYFIVSGVRWRSRAA